MMIRLLFALLVLGVFAVPGEAQVLTTSNVEINWKVANRFRLFADPGDFKRHETSYRQYLSHVDGLGKSADDKAQFIATTSVIGTEHVLNDRYIPFTRHLRTRYDTFGWARPMLGSLCYDPVKRDHSACNGTENYVSPQSHEIEAWLTPRESGLLVAEYNCQWRVGDAAAVTAPCDEPVTLTLPYPAGASISVNVEGERAISLDAKVKDLLIVGLGDSFASGEGNPDVPVVMSEKFRHRNTLPRRARNDAGGNAQWVDELCHRSLYGHQLRVALQIAIENVQSAVTFLGYSCSGASVAEGLLGPQTHMNYVSSGNGDATAIKSVKGASRDAQLFWLLRDICKEKPQRDGGFFLCPGNQFRRNVDLVLLSVGGNDIGFSELVSWATLRDNTSSTIAWLFGATVSPKKFAANMKDILPSVYAQLAKALEIAVPLRLVDNVFDPSRVVLSAYPDILEDETGNVCPSGEEGDNEGSFAANQSLDAFANWLVVTPERLAKAHAQLGDLHKRMGELAEDHGWSFAGQAYEGRAFQGHGFCARNVKAVADPAEQLAIPCWVPPDDTSSTCTGSWSGGERRWRPYNPESENYPYALRQRWVRTFNDAYLLVNQKVTTAAGLVDDRASDAVFAETTGAMHPSAEGHAAMADAILLDVRGAVKTMLGAENE